MRNTARVLSDLIFGLIALISGSMTLYYLWATYDVSPVATLVAVLLTLVIFVALGPASRALVKDLAMSCVMEAIAAIRRGDRDLARQRLKAAEKIAKTEKVVWSVLWDILSDNGEVPEHVLKKVEAEVNALSAVKRRRSTVMWKVIIAILMCCMGLRILISLVRG